MKKLVAKLLDFDKVCKFFALIFVKIPKKIVKFGLNRF